MLERRVAATEDGDRTDVVVAAWLHEPRARTQQRIAAGEVTAAGRALAKGQRLRVGERVVVATPVEPAPPPAPAPVPVRHDDDDLLVVAKPAGLVVHAGAGTRPGATLVDVLRAMGVSLAEGDDPSRPGIVHRLDRGTSGLLVVAKSQEARRGLVARFAGHHVDRRYWALVDGVPDLPRATIDAPIARSATNRARFTVAADGRRAVSHYDVTGEWDRAAAVTVSLETGRTHQVRVHLAGVGHPVAGDLVYGASPVLAEALGLRRPALHAAHLGFDHPVTGERLSLDEPLPDDLRSAVAALDRHNAR